jgi:hypothetical protein
MKKIIYVLAFIGLVFTGCDPVEDINNDLANQGNPVVGVDEFTLSSDDYEALVDQGDDEDPDFYEAFEAFSDVDDARVILPPFLSDRYPFWGDGSSVTVNFNLFDGNPESAGELAVAQTYQLTNADYAATGSDAFGFYPDINPTNEIPAVLAAQIAGPVDGQIVLATYRQYFENPIVGLANVYQAVFPVDVDNFDLISVSGPDELGWTVGAANVQGSAFDGSANALEEWLISPEIDLSGESDLLFQITQEIDFLGDDTLIDILISTDYNGGGTVADVVAANWDAIDFDKTAYGDLASLENVDFSDYDGQQVYVGLKYSSTDNDSPRWRVQDFAVQKVGIAGATDAKGEYFIYDGGSWEALEDIYYLSNSDYDSMGESSGQPGAFNNFSGSVATSDYVPQFLSMQYPFAQEDDEIFIIYRYFGGGDVGTITKGNLYTLINGTWVEETSSLQFGLKDGIWVPDNTIRYTFAGSDYVLVATTLLTTEGFESAAENLDNFGNFNRTGSGTSWSDDMMETAMDIILDNLTPSAEGGQKYIVTADTFGGNGSEDFSMIKDLETGEWRYLTDED